MSAALGFLLASLLVASTAANSAPIVQDVFTAGIGGYKCYRIPAIIKLSVTELLAFAEGRKFNCGDHGWNDLVSSRSIDGGSTWGPVTLVYGESSLSINTTIGNPAPVFIPSTSTILLPFSRNNKEANVLSSVDKGRSWVLMSTPLPVDKSWSWIATGPPGSLVLPSGRIVIPSDHINDAKLVYSQTFFSDDNGQSWNVSNYIVDGNEAQAVAMPWISDTALLMSMRAEKITSRIVSRSDDGGMTWSPSWPIITETGCEGSIVALGSLLVQSSVFNATDRVNLSLHTSKDSGVSFKLFQVIVPGRAAYSAMIAMGPNSVGILVELGNLTQNYVKIGYIPVNNIIASE